MNRKLTAVLSVLLTTALASCSPAPTERAPTAPASTTPLPTSTMPPTPITPTALPTQPFVAVLTPDPDQVQRWREYQSELAKLILSNSGADSPDYYIAVCEWDILRRSGQDLFVWAVCGTAGSNGGRPAVIHLAPDGSVLDVEVPLYGNMTADRQRLFPADLQATIDQYFSSRQFGRFHDMKEHMEYRLLHPEVPPLIVLSVIAEGTPWP